MSETKETRFGFTYGPAVVARLMDEEKHGAWLEISGVRERVTIRVTKGGRVRVFKVEPSSAEHVAFSSQAPPDSE